MAGVNVKIGADSTDAERTLGSFERKTKKIASSIAKGFKERIGHKLFDGLARSAAKIPGMLNDAVNSASDLNEELSKSQMVFGGSAKEILAWAKTSAQSMGISNVAALQASGNFGNVFRAMGITEGKAADMSRTMVELAADLGSLNNTTTEDAINAIGSALRGQSESIERYGVFFDEATLKAQAMAMGIYDGVGALKPAIKAQAAYQVILKQTTIAQGNFKNTSDGLANSKKILFAQLSNVSTEVGEALLPAMTKLVTLLNNADIESFAKDIGSLASMFVTLGENIGDAYTSAKDFISLAIEGLFPSPVNIERSLAEALNKREELNKRIAAEREKEFWRDYDKEFEFSPKEQESNARWAKLLEKIRKDKELGNPAIAANDKERESVDSLGQSYIKMLDILEKKASIHERRKQVLADLISSQGDALYQFGLGSGKKVESRVSELMDMGLGENESKEIAGKEQKISDLFQTRDKLDAITGRSSNLAVSSMQRIGGGGGSYGELDLQKRQASLQEKMVSLLSDIKASTPNVSISDF